ncbi:MAG: hypothetical protein AAF502_06905 [Bacteroidota bacterium]
MEKQHFERIKELLTKLVFAEEERMFSGRSLKTIITHFSDMLNTNLNDNDSSGQVDAMLNHWESNIDALIENLTQSAKEGNSYINVQGRSVLLIREGDAEKTKDLCPPPAGEIKA